MKQAAHNRSAAEESPDEQAFGRRVAMHLDLAAHELDDGIAQRLRAVRERALQAHRPQAGLLGRLAGTLAMDGVFRPGVRRAFAAVAVIALLLAGDYWANWSQLIDLEELDTALLADELPIDAYLDADFTRWLQQDSRS